MPKRYTKLLENYKYSEGISYEKKLTKKEKEKLMKDYAEARHIVELILSKFSNK